MKQNKYLLVKLEKIKQSSLSKNAQKLNYHNQLCPEHTLPLKYHCLTCHVDICSDCGLISLKHKNHMIQPIEMIKPSRNLVSQSRLKQIKLRISQKLNFSKQQQKQYILQMQLLKSQIKYNKTKIYEYYQQLILRLQKESQILLKDIQAKIYQCSKSINQKTTIKQKLQSCSAQLQIIHMDEPKIQINDKDVYKYLLDHNYIKLSQQNQTVKKSKSPPKRKNALNKKQYERGENIQQRQQFSESASHGSHLFDKKIYELGIMKQIYPDYHNFSFQFDYILQKDQDIVYSSNFEVFGYEWRIKIYPKGNAQAFNQNVSVFLELVNSPQALTTNSSREYFFRLQLLNLNQAGKSVIKEYNSKFSVGQCWGYAQFVPLNQINDYLHDGKLLFVMGVKNISYFDLCENMKRYILKLQGQNKILSQLCQNYYIGSNNISNNLNNQLSINTSSSIQNSGHQNIHQDDISSIISSFDEN